MRASVLVACVLLPSVVCAATPELKRVLPRGAQRGTEVKVRLQGKRLQDPKEVFLYEPGIEVVALSGTTGKRVDVTFRIAPDCPLGEHGLRLRTASGISELRTFHVGALPHTPEVEPNGDQASAQSVPLETTLTGVIQSEDVDVFAFEGKAGQRITAELEGLRLGEVLFDPFLAILDAKRFELAASDDTPLTGPDPVISVVLPEDGTYSLVLRDSAYRGGDRYRYRLHLGTFPRPLVAYPGGGKPGEALELALLGDAQGRFAQTIQIPSAAGPTFPLYPEQAGQASPTPLPFRVSPLPSHLESEPNHRQKANPVSVPSAVHGVLSKPGDVDFYRFTAKKNQTLIFQAFARALGSPHDPVLNVFEAGGKHLGGNDDNRGAPDSVFRFKVPKDGDYELRVRDFLNRGGEAYAYRVEVDHPRPQVGVTLRHYGRPDSQERQAIAVPQGNRFAVLVQATRVACGGPLKLWTEGLPPGVRVNAPIVHKAVGSVPVVFEATADAAIGGALARLHVKLDDPKRDVAGELGHVTNLVMGAPNNSVYWTRTDDRLAVAVTEPAPFAITLTAPAAPMVRNGSTALEIVATRAKGFDKPIDVFLLSNPPGCGSRGKVTIPKGKLSVRLPMNANGRAALGHWPIVAVARAGHQGPLWVSSDVQRLEVAAPYLTAKVHRAAAEQGKPSALNCTIKVQRPFPGKAPARLHGLPPGVTAPTLHVDAKTQSLVFPLTVTPKAKLGKHRPVLQVVLALDGHPVTHRLGATELRVDRPRPKAKPKPAPKPTPGKAPPSRLEQLREEFARQAEGAPQ